MSCSEMGQRSLMKGLPQTLVHNFQFEFLERPQLIPFVRAKVSWCFYDDLLTSPKSQTSLAACVFLFVILALCCLFLLLFCFVLWCSGYQAVKQKNCNSSDVTSSQLGVSHTTRKKRRDGEDGFALLSCSSHKASRFSYFQSFALCRPSFEAPAEEAVSPSL